MPKIDIPIKRLFQRRPADWARYVQPGCREEWVNTFKTNYTPKKESRLDSVLEINDPSGTFNDKGGNGHGITYFPGVG